MADEEETTPSEGRRCAALTKRGAYCRALALPGGEYCFAHVPGSAEARVQGGKARSNVRRGLRKLPPNLREVMDLIAVGVEEVHQGKLKPAQLSAMAAGGRTLIELVEAAILAPELEALRSQVAELLAQKQQEESGRYVES